MPRSLNVDQPNSWKLTENELLLIRAALYRGPVSLQAWDKLSITDDFDNFGRGAINLFPELYVSLTQQQLNHSLLPRLKGIYKHTWARNQVMFARVREVLRMFEAHGIQAMLLKGAALSTQHYSDVGGRFMLDVDLMVPYEKSVEAFNLLLGMKWRPAGYVPQPFELSLRLRHAIGFDAPSDPVSVDLHWNAIQLSRGPRADADFWDGRVPIRFGDLDTFALNPADQLLQVLAQACNWWIPSPVCWVRDALVMIMKSEEFPIDWTRLDAAAHQRGIGLGVRRRIDYLRRQFDVTIPDFVCTSKHTSFHQRIEGWSFSHPQPYGPVQLCSVLLMRFLRLPADFRAQEGVLALPRFIQHALHVRRLRDVPSVFFRVLRNATLLRLRRRLLKALVDLQNFAESRYERRSA